MVKNKIHNIVQKGSNGKKVNIIFDYIILLLILLSVISIILESMPTIQDKYGLILRGFNVFTIVVFSLEYLMRLYVSDLTHPSNNRFKSMLKFIFSTYGLVDLLAVLPFYLPMLIKMDLRFLRVLRLTTRS